MFEFLFFSGGTYRYGNTLNRAQCCTRSLCKEWTYPIASVRTRRSCQCCRYFGEAWSPGDYFLPRLDGEIWQNVVSCGDYLYKKNSFDIVLKSFYFLLFRLIQQQRLVIHHCMLPVTLGKWTWCASCYSMVPRLSLQHNLGEWFYLLVLTILRYYSLFLWMELIITSWEVIYRFNINCSAFTGAGTLLIWDLNLGIISLHYGCLASCDLTHTFT